MELCYTPFDQAAQNLGCPALNGEPMSRHTTFQIGGPADRFVTVETGRQLKGLLQVLHRENLPYMILGKGSNLLVSDRGIRGAVLLLAGEFRRVELLPGGLIRAGSGASLASVCAFAREHSLTGLEFAWGIPGSVGGAAYMDAGAYGGEMRDVVECVRHLTPEGEEGCACGEELDFSYRHSRYTGGHDVITAVEFLLEPGDPVQIAAKMEELMGRRKEKQPYDMPSAGSVFKRPQGAFAAALIEECGLKGRSVGGAQVSEKHAGFIVNTGGATCGDVLELVRQVQEEVYEKKGIRLEMEVRVTGEVK
ncbi:MAG: UDP-N-acetylmuramate dehydrogenase [Acutalibacter sp.]|jgi:UDP-N-acetylmuramate dehydrogenase